MPDTNTDIRGTLNDFFRAVEAMELDRVATFFDEDAQMFSPLGTYPARLDGRAAILAQFKAIADATSLPVMLYNIPGRCGVDIGPETVLRLANECRNIVSIKEASGSVERVSELRRRLPESFTILSGDDSLTLPFMSVGAVGVVSVASNLYPAEVCALVRAFESGDAKLAERQHRKMFGIFKDLFIEPNPVPVKTALAWRGEISGEVRLPLCDMIEANRARLRKTIEEFERP